MLEKGNNILSLKEIKWSFERLLTTNYQIADKFSISTYHTYITQKKHLNYAYKRFKKTIGSKADSIILSDRIEYSKKIIYLIYKGYKINYVDETGFNLNFRSNYGYGLRGKDLRLNYISPKGKNYSLICAIDDKEVIGYTIFDGAITGNEFYLHTRV